MGWEGSFRAPPEAIRERVRQLFGGVDPWPGLDQRWEIAREMAGIVGDLPLYSWWRDPVTNAELPNSANLSQHQLGLAWDVTPLPPDVAHRLAEALRQLGFGYVYEKKRGVHAQWLNVQQLEESGAADLIRALQREAGSR